VDLDSISITNNAEMNVLPTFIKMIYYTNADHVLEHAQNAQGQLNTTVKNVNKTFTIFLQIVLVQLLVLKAFIKMELLGPVFLAMRVVQPVIQKLFVLNVSLVNF
jgi:uncharacterized MAPEG superfamily protein